MRIGDAVQDEATGLASLHGATGTMPGLEAAVQEQAAEDELIEIAKERSVTERGSSSTERAVPRRDSSQNEVDDVPEVEEDEEEVSPEGDVVSRSRRGRERTEATQAGEELDWTGFNLKRAIQLLG